jgi:hypothetical protein
MRNLPLNQEDRDHSVPGAYLNRPRLFGAEIRAMALLNDLLPEPCPHRIWWEEQKSDAAGLSFLYNGM